MKLKQKWFLLGLGAGLALASLLLTVLPSLTLNTSLAIIIASLIIGGLIFNFVISEKKEGEKTKNETSS